MRYKHIATGIIAELVKRVGDNLLCVDVENRNHYLCYPVEQWEAQP
jgi:hypothetical protein